jgi:hypothetical protein
MEYTKKKRKKRNGKRRYPRLNQNGLNREPCLLFWSSLVLVTNMWTAFFMGQYIYSFLFASLVISSLIVHSYSSIITNIWDKIWVGSVIIFGGYKVWKNKNKSSIWVCVLTFLFCVWVYIYGFITEQYCFCKDVIKANIWHALMHVIGSLGHHFIIFL